MRMRISLLALMIGLVAWFGCDEQMAPEPSPDSSPSFAAGSPPPDACDVKGLPTKDYFANRNTIKIVSGLLRDLAAACVDQTAVAEGLGFEILSFVEDGRRIPADPEEASLVYQAGGDIVSGVWGAMEYAGFACEPDCTTLGPTPGQAAAALAPGGAFGVRSGPGNAAVYAMGDASADRWGVEPDGAGWNDAIPGSHVLIYGSPPLISGPGLGDEPIGGGFDWVVTPWHSDPWHPNLTMTAYLLVGTCAVPVQTALISHERSTGEALLPEGGVPSYCSAEDPLLVAGPAAQASRLAAVLLPFWPQPLNAALAAGVSGSGKAREFSPFYGYDTSPDATVTISEPYGGPTPVGSEICFNPPECSPFKATWTTAGLSPLATWETVLVYTKDNNGATVDFGGDFTTPPGWAVCEAVERNRIQCECDAREGIANCAGIQLDNLTLNKPGGYQICVEGQPNSFSSGLHIYACTQTFHISPK